MPVDPRRDELVRHEVGRTSPRDKSAVRRCAVVGSPIAHSRSPALHNAAYRQLGLVWEYGRAELHEGELKAFVAELDDSWRGLSVTMPLKRDALALADVVSPTAEVAGAANTLVFEAGGPIRGYNTDVDGVTASINAAVPDRVGSACVWGAGSTAAAALVAMVAMTVGEVHLHARSGFRAALAAADRAGLGVDVRGWAVGEECAHADLVFLTVPAGAADDLADALAAHAGPGRVLFDVVYEPWPTVVAQAWRRTGGTVVSGLDLLVNQAVGQVKLMTGLDVPASVLYAAVP